MRVPAPVIGFVVLAGLVAAPAIARRLTKVPVATPVGAPVSCLMLSEIRETAVRSDTIIDFRTNGKKWYRNTLPHACPSLGFEESFGYATSMSQLCNVDVITVLRSGAMTQGPSCGLGQFQPVELSKMH
jgi:hypothetical protein